MTEAKTTTPRITLDEQPASVRVVVRGETIADTRRAIVLRERGLPPVHYVPREDVRMERLAPSERLTHCPYKGDASYWHVEVEGKRVENAVWSYPSPIESVAPIAGHIAFHVDRMDAVEVD